MITKDSHHETQCWSCHTSYVLPRALYVAARASEKISFFCPYGHEGHYAQGDTPEDILRRERDRLKQQVAQLEDTQRQWIRRNDETHKALIAERKAYRKVKTRVSSGVCACCNRSFANMAAHMKTKHPEFRAEAA